MLKQHWQVTEPFTAVIFDCDGTLSSIEGIDYLAKLQGVYAQVAKLTQRAMSTSGLTPELYEQRLAWVKPSRSDVQRLGVEYCHHLMPHVVEVIATLQQFNKDVYIISAGLRAAVNEVALHLAIPETHVQAVDIFFNDHDAYDHFDLQSPLIHNQGKQKFVQDIQKNHSQILYVGDGLNDLAMQPLVTRFVGFGGAFYREHIANKSDFYITDYATLLPLALTKSECDILNASALSLYQQGLFNLHYWESSSL